MAVTIKGFGSDWSVPEPAKDKLGALYAAKGTVPPHLTIAEDTPSEALARWVDFSEGEHRIAIAGDSTWNDGGDAPRKLLLWLQDHTPTGVGLQETRWDDPNQEYFGPVVVRAADTSNASTGGVVLSDDFNRTAAELVGSTTSGGQTWGGNTGSWSSNGATATAPTGTGSLTYNTTAKDHSLTLDLSIATAASATQPQTRIYFGSTSATPTTGGNYLWLQFQRNTSGLVGISLWKRVNAVSTQIGASDWDTGLTADSATHQPVTAVVDLNIQNVTATVTVGATVNTISGTVTETEYGSLGTYVGFNQINNGEGQMLVDSATAETPYTPGQVTSLEILNAAVSGTTLDHQRTRIAQMYPAGTHIDSIVVTGGHNNGDETPDVFLAEVDAFVTEYRAAHPETRVMIASQNPQKSPSARIEVHARRQAALRQYAMENGYEYLPVYESFVNQADGGDSLIHADGIHPTTSDPIISLGWSGATLIAAVWVSAVNARRHVGVMSAITALP